MSAPFGSSDYLIWCSCYVPTRAGDHVDFVYNCKLYFGLAQSECLSLQNEPNFAHPSFARYRRQAPLLRRDKAVNKRRRPERISLRPRTLRLRAGAQGFSRYCRRQSQMRGLRAACINLKFTTNKRRQTWNVGVWLTEEATSGQTRPKAASPVHLSHWHGRQAREL
jgi:hypothetical protein